MQGVQGLPIKTIKEVTAKLTPEMARIAHFALGMPGCKRANRLREGPMCRRAFQFWGSRGDYIATALALAS
jgi:hypothetical protein